MSKKVILRCSDGEEFVVDELAAKESQTIRHMIEDECTENGIPLPNVASKTLAKVIEYCNMHADASAAAAAAERPTAAGASSKKAAGKRLKEWDTDFVKVDLPILVDLAKAAHFLNIQGLLDLTCQTMANMIKGKSTEEIRKTFNLKNDFTPEEEEEMRRENQWALG